MRGKQKHPHKPVRQGGEKGRKKVFPEAQLSRTKKLLKQEQEQIAELERLIQEEAPAPGSIPSGKSRFDELPISTNTIKGERGRRQRAAAVTTDLHAHTASLARHLRPGAVRLRGDDRHPTHGDSSRPCRVRARRRPPLARRALPAVLTAPSAAGGTFSARPRLAPARPSVR